MWSDTIQRRVGNWGWLNNNGIHFIREYKIEECKNVRPLPFDFYLPDTNILIEYDGIQHYDKDNRFYSEQLEINDNIKTNYCIDNKIKLIRIPYWDFDNIINILESEIKQ